MPGRRFRRHYLPPRICPGGNTTIGCQTPRLIKRPAQDAQPRWYERHRRRSCRSSCCQPPRWNELAAESVIFKVSPASNCIVSVFAAPPFIWLIWLPDRLSDALTLAAVKSIDCTSVSDANNSGSPIVPELAAMLTELLPLPPLIVVPRTSDEWSTMKRSSPPPPNRGIGAATAIDRVVAGAADDGVRTR